MSPNTPPQPENLRTDITRRRLLAGAVAGGVALVGLPTPARANEPAVEALGTSDLARLLPEVLTDPTARDLHADLVADGWHRRLHDAVGHRATAAADPGPYAVIAIPYRRPRSDDQAVLLWAEHDALPTRSWRFVEGTDDAVEMQTTSVEDGELTTSSTEVAPAFFHGLLCWDLNWACVLSVAGAWMGSIAACAACVLDPTRITCLACIGAVLAATGGTLGCEFCND